MCHAADDNRVDPMIEMRMIMASHVLRNWRDTDPQCPLMASGNRYLVRVFVVSRRSGIQYSMQCTRFQANLCLFVDRKLEYRCAAERDAGAIYPTVALTKVWLALAWSRSAAEHNVI